jgi:hypothetical protein
VITTHRNLFKSSKKKSGYWTLRSLSSFEEKKSHKRGVKRKRTHSHSLKKQRSPQYDLVSSDEDTGDEDGERSTSTTNVTDHYISSGRWTVHSVPYSVPITWRRRRRLVPLDENVRRTRSTSTGVLEPLLSTTDRDSKQDSHRTPIQILIPKGWVEKCARHPLLTVNPANIVIPVPKWKPLKETSDNQTTSRRLRSLSKRTKKKVAESLLVTTTHQNNFHGRHTNNIHTNHHRSKRRKVGLEGDDRNNIIADESDSSSEVILHRLHIQRNWLTEQLSKIIIIL